MLKILALALAAVSSAKTLERGKFLSSETILYFFENSLVLQVKRKKTRMRAKRTNTNIFTNLHSDLKIISKVSRLFKHLQI